MKKSSSRKPGRAGLAKKTRYPTADWQLDQDYIPKLSETEKDWLNQFNKEYYLSNDAGLHTPEQIRERWRAFKQNARDVVSREMADEASPFDNSQPKPPLEAEEDAAIARIDARRALEREAATKGPKTTPIGSTSLKN